MSSDEEMGSPVPKKNAGRKSGGGKKKEPTPPPIEDEEAYEIDYILKARRPKGSDQWEFEVRWVGYDESEDSWVKEEDFNGRELIDEFWKKNPGIKGNPLTVKQPTKGRKSNASATNGSRASLKGRKSKGGDESDDASSKPAKRKTSKAEDDDEIVSATPDVVEDEDERPKKKSKTVPNKAKKSGSENGFFSDVEDTTAGAGHDINAMDKHMGKKSWEKLIETIETVEQAEDGDLMVYFTATDGSKAICNSRVLSEKAPQRLIKFYEGHLRWRGASPKQ